MVLIAVIDGPEKAGKSSLCARLRHYYPGLRIRHWFGRVWSPFAYVAAMQEDIADPVPVVWDRSWASECVYSQLLSREDIGFRDDWWLAAWLYDRVVQTVGVRVMLLGSSVAELAARRTPDDLPCDPAAEQSAFRSYACRFGWSVYDSFDDPRLLEEVLGADLGVASFDHDVDLAPPAYCGPRWPLAVFVADRRNMRNAPAPDYEWLPFASPLPTQLARSLGDVALCCGWTNQADNPRSIFPRTELIVACGLAAADYCLENCGSTTVYTIPHPSALYRWGRYADARGQVEAELRRLIKSLQSPCGEGGAPMV